MLKPRIAVLVSGGGTNLQALIRARDAGLLDSGALALVVSSKAGAYALTRARQAGVEARWWSARSIRRKDAFEHALIEMLEAHKIDIIVLAGFMLILSANFVSHYPDRIINVHPSLIPAYCGKGFYGLRVHEAVLRAGEHETGATVHMVNEVPDGGRILLQKSVPVYVLDTPELLQRRVMEQAEWQLLPQAAEMVCAEWKRMAQGGR